MQLSSSPRFALLLAVAVVLGGVLVWLVRWTNAEGARLVTTLEVPATMTNGAEQDFIVTVENRGESPAERAMLSLENVTGLIILSTTKTPMVGEPDDLSLGTLPPRARVTVTVHGRVLDVTDAQRTILAQTSFHAHDLPVLTEPAQATYTVRAPELTLTIDAPANEESTIPFLVAVRLTNATAAAMQNIRLRVRIPDNLTLVQIDPPAAPNRQPLTWTFVELPMNKEVTMTLTVVGQTDVHTLATIQASVQKETATLQTAQQNVLLAPAPTVTTIAQTTADASSILRFAAEARYTSAAGVQFGYGPVPPKVGKTTGYRVFWTISQPGRLFTNVAVKATLPASADWAGNVSTTAGAGPVFDPVAHIITWQVGELAADQTNASASFDLRITPRKDDVGTTVRLLEPTRLTAKDAGQLVTRLTAPLSTDTPELAADKSIVVE